MPQQRASKAAPLTIHLSGDYGWCLLAATAIGMQCWFTAGFLPMGVRKRVFTKEFMERFKETHLKETGQAEIPKLGYPDMGSGRYAQELSYKDWYDLNNAQRAHLNQVENIGFIIPSVLIAGIRFPRAAAAFGFTYFVARILYSIGYRKSPQARVTGARLSGLSTFALFLLATISSVKQILSFKQIVKALVPSKKI